MIELVHTSKVSMTPFQAANFALQLALAQCPLTHCHCHCPPGGIVLFYLK